MASTINASTSLGLQHSADTSGILQLQTANTAALTIDGSQNVGVGTASPSAKLDISGTTTSDIYRLRSNQSAPASTDAFIFRPADNTLGFGTASAERMRLTSAGYLGIGTTTPSTALQVVGTGTFTTVVATTITEGTSPLVTQADIGSGANEIPLNQYLGKLAYLDGPAGLAPTSSSAVGTTGQLAADSTYLYVCVAPSTWKRITLSSF